MPSEAGPNRRGGDRSAQASHRLARVCPVHGAKRRRLARAAGGGPSGSLDARVDHGVGRGQSVRSKSSNCPGKQAPAPRSPELHTGALPAISQDQPSRRRGSRRFELRTTRQPPRPLACLLPSRTAHAPPCSIPGQHKAGDPPMKALRGSVRPCRRLPCRMLSIAGRTSFGALLRARPGPRRSTDKETPGARRGGRRAVGSRRTRSAAEHQSRSILPTTSVTAPQSPAGARTTK